MDRLAHRVVPDRRVQAERDRVAGAHERDAVGADGLDARDGECDACAAAEERETRARSRTRGWRKVVAALLEEHGRERAHLRVRVCECGVCAQLGVCDAGLDAEFRRADKHVADFDAEECSHEWECIVRGEECVPAETRECGREWARRGRRRLRRRMRGPARKRAWPDFDAIDGDGDGARCGRLAADGSPAEEPHGRHGDVHACDAEDGRVVAEPLEVPEAGEAERGDGEAAAREGECEPWEDDVVRECECAADKCEHERRAGGEGAAVGARGGCAHGGGEEITLLYTWSVLRVHQS